MMRDSVGLRRTMTVLLVLAGIAVGGVARAQQPAKQLLDQARRLNTVAAQKLEADIRGALFQAQRLAFNNPDKAVEKLKSALALLEDDTTLPEERKTSLTRAIKNRIESINSGGDAKALTEKEVQASIRKLEDRKENDEKATEGEKIRRALASVVDLQKNGKLAEARKQADELAKLYPNNPAAVNMARTTAAFEQLVSARDIKKDKEKGVLAALRDVDRSSIPPKDDIEFPKDWKERTKNRTANRFKLSPKEKAIMQSLNMSVSVSFKDDKFQDVMEYLSTLMGQPILLNKQDLADASITYETPISLAVKNVTARTILRKVLGEFGLTYIIKDETIQVVSALKAKDMMVVRSYYIGDLLGSRGGPGDPLTYIYGPAIQQVQMIQNLASIMDLIQMSFDPQSWQSGGGSGAVYFHYPTLSLVIKQSAEVHGMIASNLLP